MMSWSSGEVINSQARLRRLSGSIPSSYTIMKIGSTYYAECNVPGGTGYSGDDAATVIQAAIDALKGGVRGKIILKNGIYLLNSGLVPYDALGNFRLVIEGEGWGTVLRANSAMNVMMDLDAINPQSLVFRDFQVDAFDLADYCFYSDYAQGMSVHFENIWGRRAKIVNLKTTGTGELKFFKSSFNDTKGIWDVYFDGGTGTTFYSSTAIRAYIASEFQAFDAFFQYVETPDDQAIAFCSCTFDPPNSAWGKTENLLIGGTGPGYTYHTTVANCRFKVPASDIGLTAYIKAQYTQGLKLMNNFFYTGTHQPTNFINLTSDSCGTEISGYRQSVAEILNSGVGTRFYGSSFENSGTATILNAAATVKVTHGLAGDPTNVRVTGTHAEVKNCIITNLDPDGDHLKFEITAPDGVTSGDRTVYWDAEYTP